MHYREGTILKIEWLGEIENVLLINDVCGCRDYLVVDLSTMSVLTSVQIEKIEQQLKILKFVGVLQDYLK